VKKILVIGATSAIAEESARIWAQRGERLFLVARNLQRLDTISKDLSIRGSSQVGYFCMDVNNFELHLPMLEAAKGFLENIDIVLIAHGTLPRQKNCEQSIELTMLELKTNALSIIALLTPLASIFELQKNGTIAVISSVAGDRGRQSNYVYGSAKAMITTFLSGLRQRLYKSGVVVVDIKPGFVDTPMTADFKKGLLWSLPSNVAKSIVNICDKGSNNFYVPKFWFFIMLIIKLIPEEIYKKLKL